MICKRMPLFAKINDKDIKMLKNTALNPLERTLLTIPRFV